MHRALAAMLICFFAAWGGACGTPHAGNEVSTPAPGPPGRVDSPAVASVSSSAAPAEAARHIDTSHRASPEHLEEAVVLEAGKLPAESAVLGLKSHCGDQCDVNSPEGLDPSFREPSPVWISSATLASGSRNDLPYHPNATLFALVLAGSVQIARPDTSRVALRPWRAARIPNGGLRLIDGGQVVLAWVAHEGTLSRDDFAKAPAGHNPTVSVVDLNAAKDLSWAGGKAHARLGFEDGPASFGLLLTTADASVPPHRHASSWEAIAFLAGDGTLTRHGEDRPAAPVRLTRGDMAAIPPTQRHGWTPSGKQPLLALQMYVPPGPEQRFKQLALQAASPP